MKDPGDDSGEVVNAVRDKSSRGRRRRAREAEAADEGGGDPGTGGEHDDKQAEEDEERWQRAELGGAGDDQDGAELA